MIRLTAWTYPLQDRSRAESATAVVRYCGKLPAMVYRYPSNLSHPPFGGKCYNDWEGIESIGRLGAGCYTGDI